MLHDHEFRAIRQISNVLIAPFSLGSIDAWRSEVNRLTRALVGADSAGFLFPTVPVASLYSDEHDPAELAKYVEIEVPALSNGRSVWDRGLELGAGTLSEIYGQGYRTQYLESAYYREYAAPNRAHDTLMMMTPALGTDIRTVASLQFWHDSPRGRKFGGREVFILQQLLPALRAGVQAYVAWWRHGESLGATMDRLGLAISLWTLDGKEMHQSPAMTDALAGAHDGERLTHEVLQIVDAVRRGETATLPKSKEQAAVVSGELALAGGEYFVSGALHAMGAGDPPLIVISLLGGRTACVTADDLCNRWGLTRSESRVALLLAEGLSNREIADRLSVSDSTTRRHTERVLAKLGVSSRARVGPAIGLRPLG
jgi:DNA-binding CsgD family transcriptional regulator